MINKLPNELLVKIFHLLERKTKYECALVCRQWTHAAQKCLYYKIRLYGQKTFVRFFSALKLNPSLAKMVIQFTWKSVPPTGFDKRLVYEMLPNLQNIEFHTFQPAEPLADYIFDQSKPNSPLESTLESVCEYYDYTFTSYLINANLTNRLKELSISYHPKQENEPNILSQLKNLPILENLHLSLRGFTLTLNDIDKLHQNIPSIVNLHFHGANLKSCELSTNIKPTPTIKSMCIEYNYISNSEDIPKAYIQCFRYFQLKYSHVESLSINYNAYDSLTLYERERIIRHGWKPLLQSMAPHLKNIGRVDVLPDMDIFSILDSCGSKVESLKTISCGNIIALDGLTQSNQRHYIQNLYVDAMSPTSNVSLQNTKLKKLSLYYEDDNSGTPIILNHILKLCPDTLETLEIMNAIVDYDIDDDFKSPITTLSVNRNGSGWINGSLANDVNNFCPKLKYKYISAI